MPSGVGEKVATTEGQLRCECNTGGRVTVYSSTNRIN